MRFKPRHVLLALVAVFAMSAVAASTASAAAPEFKPSTKQAFTGSTGTITFERSSYSPTVCTKGTSTGEITGASTVGAVVLTLTGCESKEGPGCKFKSVGAKNNGEIVTSALVGELGEVKTTEATTGVGLLLKPASGTEWAKIEAPCILPEWESMKGEVTAEVTPIKTLAKTVELVLTGKSGAQRIKKITIKGKVNEPVFQFQGVITNWDATDTLAFTGSEVEIS